MLDEASIGDPIAAATRLAMLHEIDLIPTDSRIEVIADELISRSLMPAKARLDALHVATAAGLQFLLTQNCRHIANGHTLPRVYKALEDLGFPNFLIYTPAVFLEDDENDTESNT